MRHRALTRYKNKGKHRGKTIPQHEIHRRIAQSFGRSVLAAPKPLIESKETNTVFV